MKDLTNRLLFPLIASFWKHTFFARMRRLDNGCPFSVPPISIILNFPKIFLVKADIKQLSPKKIEKFDEKWRNTRHICIACLAACFRVKELENNYFNCLSILFFQFVCLLWHSIFCWFGSKFLFEKDLNSYLVVQN